MNTKQTKPITARERGWVLFNNGCIHGIQHSELVVVPSVPHRSLVQDSVAVFTVSKTFSIIAALAGCSVPRPQKGGGATSTVSRSGHTNSTTLTQARFLRVIGEDIAEKYLMLSKAMTVRAAFDCWFESRPDSEINPEHPDHPNYSL